MLKKLCLGLTLLVHSFALKAQDVQIDTTALTILDNMSQIFGSMSSIGFESNISRDIAFSNEILVKEFVRNEIKIKGPNKFVSRISGEKKEELYKYNGKQVTYYSLTTNRFAVADAPDNLIETLDWLYTDYGIEFTAGDIFYPNFTQDLAENMDHIQFLGVVTLNDKRTFHILARNDLISVQFWIADEIYMVPKKIVLTYLDRGDFPQFEIDFANWEINHEYPDGIFEFEPPPASKQITWIKKD